MITSILSRSDALIKTFQNVSAPTFLEEHLFDSVPHVFAGDRSVYIAWKRELAGRLMIPLLTIVGSAAVGL